VIILSKIAGSGKHGFSLGLYIWDVG